MIEVLNISKSFNGQAVLKNFSAKFTEGATCVMGVSGVGKTTLVNIVLGLVKPDSGSVIGLSDKTVACVFQEDRLIDGLTALKNVMLPSKKENTDKAKEILQRLGLAESMHKPVNTLSGGMKRRVAIARALINKSHVYIFDEPFKGLDDKSKKNAINVINTHTAGAVKIYITHDKADANLLNAKVIEIKE